MLPLEHVGPAHGRRGEVEDGWASPERVGSARGRVQGVVLARKPLGPGRGQVLEKKLSLEHVGPARGRLQDEESQELAHWPPLLEGECEVGSELVGSELRPVYRFAPLVPVVCVTDVAQSAGVSSRVRTVAQIDRFAVSVLDVRGLGTPALAGVH